ncbi:MAG: ABC transporter ATP-binding protein [Defluviitaleaceae bacterium]|nr:ABC transporter ATP-binding protein [Defluviitaleaceae bacterium]
MQENRIEFRNVTKKIKKQEIIKDISFTVKRGEVVGIIGENGSGKTTVLRLASGLSYPTSGEVSVNGKIIEAGKSGILPENIGILIEAPTFIKELTGFDNLNYLSKIRNEITKEDIIKAMEQVGLDPKNKKKVATYSLGMRQRLGIAQAIMEKPNIILFDEPTNGLDLDGIERFEEIVTTLKKQGTSFIFVSHSMEEIDKLCDSVFKLKDKRIILQERMRDWHIVLNSLEDVERVSQLRKNVKITDRYDGKPAIVIPFKVDEDIKIFFDQLKIDYKVLVGENNDKF